MWIQRIFKCSFFFISDLIPPLMKLVICVNSNSPSTVPNYLFYTVKLYVAWLTSNKRHVVYLYVQTLHYLYRFIVKLYWWFTPPHFNLFQTLSFYWRNGILDILIFEKVFQTIYTYIYIHTHVSNYLLKITCEY